MRAGFTVSLRIPRLGRSLALPGAIRCLGLPAMIPHRPRKPRLSMPHGTMRTRLQYGSTSAAITGLSTSTASASLSDCRSLA